MKSNKNVHFDTIALPNELRSLPTLLMNIRDLNYGTVYPLCTENSEDLHIIRNCSKKIDNLTGNLKEIMAFEIARVLYIDTIGSEELYFMFSLPLFVQLKILFCLLIFDAGFSDFQSDFKINMIWDEISSNSMKDTLHVDSGKCCLHNSHETSDKENPNNDWQLINNDTFTILNLSAYRPEVVGNLPSLKYTLLKLRINCTSFNQLPIEITKINNLVKLDIDGLSAESLPEELADLCYLEQLSLKNNIFKEIPPVLFRISSLKVLDLNSFHYPPAKGSISLENLQEFEKKYKGIFNKIGSNKINLSAIFSKCAKKNMSYIYDTAEKVALSAEIYKKIPHISSNPFINVSSGFSWEKVHQLDLSYQAFKILDDNIQHVKNLRSLNLSYNLFLEEVSSTVGLLPLKSLKLNGCPSLKTPPKEILRKGEAVVINYMKRLNEGFVECRRTKLMLVGLGGAGKTSLIRKLTSSENDKQENIQPDVTDGIDIQIWKSGSIEYSIWDFAGQEVYYNTHQFFLTNRSVYLLLWNVRSGYEHSGLKFWLSSIACHAPRAPVFVVGTHVDQVENTSIPTDDLKESYPQICGFHFVSSFTGKGIEDLRNNIILETLKEKYMDEKIPVAYLQFEKKLLNSNFEDLIPLEKAIKLAYDCGIANISEIFQATEFLHELGSIQHFQNEFLKSMIIINPQWIINVMACLITVHENAVSHGRLYHKDMELVWPIEQYAKDIHNWILRLTEEFDLTFPVKNDKASLIPCLLPSDEPESLTQFFHGKLEKNETRMKMIFEFDYLPDGLCNRAQARLYQFSDGANVWKNGSILFKNRHKGVLIKTDENTILVDARGPQPENILFLIFDVFKNLIHETFTGVKYDCLISCKECIFQGSLEPCLVPHSRIKKAIDLKIPFIQCTDNFHILSITELKGMIPPETANDFDFHLENDIRNLRKIRSQTDPYIVLLFSSHDLKNKQFEVTLKKISSEVKSAEIAIRMLDESCERDIQETIFKLKEAKYILALMSEKFLKTRVCKELFLYSKRQLKLKTKMILMEENDAWKKDNDVGMLCADEVSIF